MSEGTPYQNPPHGYPPPPAAYTPGAFHEPYGGPAPAYQGAYVEPHRGGLILAFGLLGWLVCGFFGVAAWIMGKKDLAAMSLAPWTAAARR